MDALHLTIGKSHTDIDYTHTGHLRRNMYRFAALGPVDQRCVAAKHIEYTSLVVHPLEFRLIQQTLVGHPGTIDHIHALLQECFRASLQQDGIVHRNIFLHQPIQFLSCFGIKRIGVTALDLIKGDMHLFAKEEITIDGSIVLQDIISKFRMGLVREISQTCHIAQDCNTVIILRNGQVLRTVSEDLTDGGEELKQSI